ncbi:MAG: LCP family protein, partial [Streptosporangiales bacterium]|nr:LCP family protein [Streptosporangiales bacterium]
MTEEGDPPEKPEKAEQQPEDTEQPGSSADEPTGSLAAELLGAEAAPDAEERPEEDRPKRKRHVLRWISVGVVVVVIAALITVFFKYKSIDDAIHRVTVSGLGNRPPVYSKASENILVFGSDSRTGLDHHMQVVLHTGDDSNSKGPGNTDTIMLLHISPGRKLVTVMSIPRDTMVQQYACAGGAGHPGQAADPQSTERINSLLATGGPSCLWKSVEQETGIRISHFVEVGLAGFANVINVLGGVNVCAPFSVTDPVSGLKLKPGENHINGASALAFWRTREDLGEGSDLQRIQRDQFMSAQVVQGVMATHLLSDPSKLLSVLSTLSSNLTTDSGLSLTGLAKIGGSLRGVPSKDVQFFTAPTVPDPENPAEVDFAQPQADELFSEIARDATDSGSAKSSGGVPAGEVAPSAVKVQVLNGSGQAGVAAVAAGELSSRGFNVTGTGDATSFGNPDSVVEYGSSADLPAARTVRAQVPGAVLKLDPTLGAGAVDLV